MLLWYDGTSLLQTGGFDSGSNLTRSLWWKESTYRTYKSPYIKKMTRSEKWVGHPWLVVAVVVVVVGRCSKTTRWLCGSGLPLRNLQMAICFTPALMGALTWCHLLLRHARTHSEQPPRRVSCGDTPTTPRLGGREGRALGLPVRPWPRPSPRRLARHLCKKGLASLKRQREKHCTAVVVVLLLCLPSHPSSLPTVRQPVIHWRLTHRFHEWTRR